MRLYLLNRAFARAPHNQRKGENPITCPIPAVHIYVFRQIFYLTRAESIGISAYFLWAKRTKLERDSPRRLHLPDIPQKCLHPRVSEWSGLIRIVGDSFACPLTFTPQRIGRSKTKLRHLKAFNFY